MTNIIIFSGTTEGRTISEALSRQQVEHIVCVATQYGKEVMCENDYAHVMTGRMDSAKMSELISEHPGLVIDATHPYAVEVTANIKAAVNGTGAEYVRVVREQTQSRTCVNYCLDMEEISCRLNGLSGNILNTTGSKEIGKLKLDNMNRVYARVIPSVDSINACTEAGVPVKNIIAMQGPFSVEMNKALIREYDIKYLITKESGTTGGLPEKLQAAEECGVEIYAIGRTEAESGKTVNEVLELLGIKTQISLVAMGMGNCDTLTQEAMDRIGNAEAVFGPSRLIKCVSGKVTYDMYKADEIIPIVLSKNYKRVAVLFSGDTGFYSGATVFRRAVAEYSDRIDIDIVPGMSSLSYMASKVGDSYDDAFIYSIHGKNDARRYAILKENIMTHSKTFLLLSGAEDVRLLGNMLSGHDNIEIVLGDNLSYESERIINLTVEEAAAFDEAGMYIAFIRNNKPESKHLIPVKGDAEFIRNSTPMTKEIIRHEIVRLLDIRETDIICDVGSGTGSVSIEIASLSPTVSVYALEQKAEAIECMRQNMEKFGCTNIELIEGDANDTIENIPAPNAIFIGGSTGKMVSILKRVPRNGADIRVVVTSVTMETLMDIYSLDDELVIEDMTVRQIAVTDIARRGEHNLMQANNPVFVCSFRMK